LTKKTGLEFFGLKSDPNIKSEKITKTSNYLINNIEFLKSINFKHNYYEKRKSGDDDAVFFQKLQKMIVFYGYDYSNNLLPLLQTIYVYETPITKEAFVELINLFRVKINNKN
jgi:hypothetical protein